MKKTIISAINLTIALIYIDLFSGAGGTSTGIELAKIGDEKIAKVISCVNHDYNAIASHTANHPESQHFTEDIRTLELSPLLAHVEEMRQKYPLAKLVIWASLECTNHSNAKGGMSRDADSRTLAWDLNRYISALNPDCVQIENVREFMDWGPLKQKEKNGELLFDKKGKPIMCPDPKFKGCDYNEWKESVKSFGYNFDSKILNSADFGAFTSRKRYFAQFAKETFPIIWPEPTHSKEGNNLPKYNAVKHCLDFSDKGKSIFEGKPKVEKTLERIYAGLLKFVAGGEENFISAYYSGNADLRNKSTESPIGVVTTNNRFAKVSCEFLTKFYSGNPKTKNSSLEVPAGTITTIDHHGLVQPEFLTTYYGTGKNISSIENPSATVTTKDRIAKVSCQFIDQQFGKSKPASAETPINTITTTPKFAIVNTEFLVNPQYQSKGSSVENPCFTLIARMDKMPPYLVQTETGDIAIEIYETDSPMTKKIKEFMALYGIIDIKMRMLKISELKKIMGFPENYILIGTQVEQKKYIGNAVEVNTARAICEATANKLFELRKVA